MFLKTALLLCGLAGALAATVPVDKDTAKILEGTTSSADITAFPWQVSIQYTFGLHFCGGCIYSENIVLTSASCLAGISPTLIQVRVGSVSHAVNGSVHLVSTIITHPDFDAITSKADIAVILLETSINFGEDTQPIPLATSLIEHNAIAQVSGWGTEKQGGSISDEMSAANLRIIDWNSCSSPSYGYDTNILTGMFCAIGPTSQDTCTADIGGPLVAGGFVVGIYSWSFGCDNAAYPLVYTSISFYKNWIIDTAYELSIY